MPITRNARGEGDHQHPGADGRAVVMPALHRALMAGPLHRLFTSRVLAPWALQGMRPAGEILEVGAGVGAVAAYLLKTTPRLRMVVTDYDISMVAVADRSLRRFSGRVAVARADACD